jgi:hypothetical protein
MNTLEREIEDLRHEAALIRQVSANLRRQIADWDRMLTDCNNKLLDRLQQQRAALEKKAPYSTGKPK